MAIPLILPTDLTDNAQPIQTVEMHTTGEPTRIVYSNLPRLHAPTLLQKRTEAKDHHDSLRKRLMLEPRGHSEMYGALLVPDTELTTSGEADLGVLFMHNEGWSDMCGHATIALGRFVVDARAEVCEKLQERLKERLDREARTTEFKLHCPCGIVDVTVPVKWVEGRLRSDSKRPVSFLSVESFASGTDVKVAVPEAYTWPELGERNQVTVDFCYGRAFYCVIDTAELGFHQGLKNSIDLGAYSRATKALKTAIVADPQYAQYYRHEAAEELGSLYGVIVSDTRIDHVVEGTAGGEMGLCFFADQQVDRSPTGSGVAGRRALAHAKGVIAPETKWAYHSILSNRCGGQGAFVARLDGETDPAGGCRVLVEGRAFYTGWATYVAEEEDVIGRAGFAL